MLIICQMVGAANLLTRSNPEMETNQQTTETSKRSAEECKTKRTTAVR